MNNSFVHSIFGSTEGLLNGEVKESWGNVGYNGSAVERNSFYRNTIDIAKWFTLGAITNWFNGFKGLKTTRYFYNYVQTVVPINDKYIPDLIQTYAMTGIGRGMNPTDAVQQSIKNGRGLKLKQYYQYNRHRYRNRQWTWKAYKTKNYNPSKLVIDTTRFIESLPKDKRYMPMHIEEDFSYQNQYYLEKLKQDYGIDSLHKNAEPIEHIEVPKSVGITVWEADVNPSEVITIKLEDASISKETRLVKGMKLGETKRVRILRLFSNLFQSSTDETKTIEINNREVEVFVDITLNRVYPDYSYSFVEHQYYYDYEEENHYYLLEDGTSNYPEFSKYWNFKKKEIKLSETIDSTKSNLFQFYAPIPIKDWFEGKDTWTQTLPIIKKNNPVVKAQKKLTELLKEEYDKKDEETSANAVNANRETTRLKRKNRNKKNEEISQRKLQREITRGLARSRKIKFNKDKLADIKDYSPSALKRHIEYMSELVGINYIQYVTSLMAQEHWNGGYENANTYQSSIYLGAIFSNQTVENHHYWYEWAKRQYALSGKEQSYLEWKEAVEEATSVNDLPLQVITYKTTDKTHYGGFSFAYIKKFTIDGRVRKIKHKKRLHDILRGKPITITNINQLKLTPEAPKELSMDTWYYRESSGKEYAIDGNEFSGSGVSEGSEPTIQQVLQNYSYTLFCKNAGKGKITCYAICGLQFHTKMSERKFWCTAWQDLAYEYERNRQRYLKYKKKRDIDVAYVVDKGSRKYRHINHIHHFGLVPLDYQVIKRMDAFTLENFSQRAVLNYSFIFTEQKGKRGGMKYVAPALAIAGFIASVVLTIYGQPWGWALFAKALIIATATSIAVGLAVKHLILPFLKILGLKGLVALIITIIVVVIAMYAGGSFDGSSLPYASEIAGETAKSVGTEATKEIMKEVTAEAVKEITAQSVVDIVKDVTQEIITNTVNQIIGTSGVSLVSNTITNVSKAYTEIAQREMNSIQEALDKDREQFSQAMDDLEELQESMKRPLYDFKEALKTFSQPKHTDNFDNTYISATASDNYLSSWEYLTAFLDLKLSLDLDGFDPIKSTDFTFNTR